MEVVINWISIASLMLLVITLVNPALALPWSKEKTRRRGVSVYGCAFFASIALYIVVYPATNLESRVISLLVMCVVFLAAGLISPGIVLPWSKKPTKLSVLMFYLPPAILLMGGVYYAVSSRVVDSRYDLPPGQVESADPVTALRYAAAYELRGESNLGLPRVRSIDVRPAEGGGYNVAIEYNMDNAGTKDFFKVMLKMDMGNLYRALYTSGQDVASATITAYFPVDDPVGNEPPVRVFSTTLDKKAADEANWNAERTVLEMDILPGLWTETYVHPKYK
jgi:hypothetical protein